MSAALKSVPSAPFSELLLSFGSKAKQLGKPGEPKFRNVTFIDPVNKWVPHNMELGENQFDEIHAYHVLQCVTGQQGDPYSFFAAFQELWRILKPDGVLFATVPSPKSDWLFGDPGNARAITLQSITFLDQMQYTKQVGVTAMRDYREFYTADFDPLLLNDDSRELRIALRAVKPSRLIR